MKPYTARNRDEWKKACKKNGNVHCMFDLSKEELTSSASKWKFEHLLAFRLITNQDERVLQILHDSHDRDCPIFNKAASGPQKLRTYSLLGETVSDLGEKSESELLQEKHGPFWIALAGVVHPDGGELQEPKVYPKRDGKQIVRENYLPSSSIAIESSSPAQTPSLSDYSPNRSVGYDEDMNEERQSGPEISTVFLINSFLQSALTDLLMQDIHQQDPKAEIRPRRRSEVSRALFGNRFYMSAEDDGGICRAWKINNRWSLENPFLAILEAKRAFSDFVLDTKTNPPIPSISNETLAQLLGEAVITWKASPHYFDKNNKYT